MSFTCALLLITGALSTDWEVRRFSLNEGDLGVFLIFLLFFAGLFLSFYHAFTDRPKTLLEKKLMIFFAVIVNAFSGIWAGAYFLQGSEGWLVLFPALNIVNGWILLGMLRGGAIDERNISDENVSRGEVALASVALVSLFVVCRYVLDVVWAQTFSICVVYATNLSGPIKTLLTRIVKGKVSDLHI